MASLTKEHTIFDVCRGSRIWLLRSAFDTACSLHIYVNYKTRTSCLVNNNCLISRQRTKRFSFTSLQLSMYGWPRYSMIARMTAESWIGSLMDKLIMNAETHYSNTAKEQVNLVSYSVIDRELYLLYYTSHHIFLCSTLLNCKLFIHLIE
jgi:hypothetical protein